MASLNKDGTERRARLSWLQAENFYLKHGGGQAGASALSAKLVGHSAPKDLLDSMIEDLLGEDHDCSQLIALRETYVTKQGLRGRKAAQPGETRTYTGQQVINDDDEPGEVFLKIPVTVLGILKHGRANVQFNSDRIVIERMVEAPQAPQAGDGSDGGDDDDE